MNDRRTAKQLADRFSNVQGATPRSTPSIGDRETIIRDRSVKKGLESPKNIKYILQKTSGETTKFYICGWKQRCKLLLTLPSGTVVGDLLLNNLGGDNYLFSIYYQLSSGNYAFQFYDQNGLVKEYGEIGLKPYQYNFGVGAGNFTSAAIGFMNETYGNKFFYAIGYGRFAANFCRDSNTVDNPLNPGVQGTATTTGNLRALIDLKQNTVQKFLLPDQTASRSNDGANLADRWIDIPVFGTLSKLKASFLSGDFQTNSEGETVLLDSSADMRYLLKASKSGKTCVSETLEEVDNNSSPKENYFVITNKDGVESNYLVQGLSGGVVVNISSDRFKSTFSTLNSIAGKRFCDLTDTGFFFIERQAPNPNAKPIAVPETTQYQIERSKKAKRVTVQILSLDFAKKKDLKVRVFPPDINNAEATNFGSVVAASYG